MRTAVVFNDYTTYPVSRNRWAWACAAGQIRAGQQALPLSILSPPHHRRIKRLLEGVLEGRGIESSSVITKADRTYQLNRLLTDEEAAGLPTPPPVVLTAMSERWRGPMPLWKPNQPSTVTVSWGTPEDPQTAAIQVDANGGYTLDGEEYQEMPYPGGVMLAPVDPESSGHSYRLTPGGDVRGLPGRRRIHRRVLALLARRP